MIMLYRLGTGIVAAVTFALLMLPFGAFARQPFDAKAFEQAQAVGKTVQIDAYASWCPYCRKQQPTLTRLEKEKPELVIYEVDFDNDKRTLQKLGVTRQATLIVFKGTKEVGRSTGETDPAQIEAWVAKGYCRMSPGALALSYAAGALSTLSTLSPCVLPLLPILLASAVQRHVLGPLALAVGLAGSFAGIGLLGASLGLSLGIDSGILRVAAAILMLVAGIALLVPALQEALALRMAPLTGWAGRVL